MKLCLPVAWVFNPCERLPHGLKTRATVALLLLSHLAFAQTTMPGVLRNIGVDQNLGAQLPLDLKFRDETGREVVLREYFGKRPVVLTPVYYQCPMLCTVVLNDLLRAMNVMKSSAGEQFEIVTFSFDPRETPPLAAEKKAKYLSQYKRPAADAGWHFLTGDEAAIRALTSAAGFRYEFDSQTGQFAHASAVIVLTPQGKISRYLLGVDYTSKDLGNAIVDATGGTVGERTLQTVLYCLSYDPASGKYSLIVTRAIQVGAVLTMLCLGGFILFMLRRDARATPLQPKLPGANA